MKVFVALSSLAVVFPALAETNHYSARNCEIFVDKIGMTTGSHGSASVHVFIKTTNSHLDSRIVRVGARIRATHRSQSGTNVLDWTNDTVPSFVGSSNYFEFSRSLGSDFGSSSYDTAFFVQTERGTFYWLNPQWQNSVVSNGNFRIDENFFEEAKRVSGIQYPYRGPITDSVGTLSYPFDVMNPQGCK